MWSPGPRRRDSSLDDFKASGVARVHEAERIARVGHHAALFALTDDIALGLIAVFILDHRVMGIHEDIADGHAAPSAISTVTCASS